MMSTQEIPVVGYGVYITPALLKDLGTEGVLEMMAESNKQLLELHKTDYPELDIKIKIVFSKES